MALLLVPLAGCSGPLSTLTPAGPAARDIALLWWAMLAGSAAITVLVLALIWSALRRAPAPQSERRWIMGWGLGFSLGVLTLALGFALWIGERMLARDDGAVQVSAHARQWSWSFTQPGPDGSPVETQGVLYVPAGQPFDVTLTAADVIHSFWVPQLGGKMDAIPGHANRHRLSADAPGTYQGLCAEFCGLGHTAMRFSVVVYDPAGPLPDFTDAPPDDGPPLPADATPAPEDQP
ncbi:MAG: cytochrome B [Paracoccus sp. (in: a-proteobacteria)]|uniref:cytochrome c oxidase subunit II n=1 Tax=Paracoccus sp. TaxID=267 RepID=UPI0026DEB10F|nr:cytochrome B [Paracoccus sp. (in: a-proteobacteria)]MDO5611984.1 cytochrome B [Paracoccus sp. (in: a-proteobacteria)]